MKYITRLFYTIIFAIFIIGILEVININIKEKTILWCMIVIPSAIIFQLFYQHIEDDREKRRRV